MWFAGRGIYVYRRKGRALECSREVRTEVPPVIVGREESFEHPLKRFTETLRPSRFVAKPRNREHHENPSVKPTR